MGRSRETYNKKEVRNKKEKKRKEKEKKKQERKEKGTDTDMFVFVDENGMLTSTPPDPANKSTVDLEDIEISIPKSDPNDKADTTRTGVVVFFNDAKGFGFIRDSITKESIFAHINNAIDEIKEGNKVTFETEKGPKGLTATQIKLFKEKTSS